MRGETALNVLSFADPVKVIHTRVNRGVNRARALAVKVAFKVIYY